MHTNPWLRLTSLLYILYFCGTHTNPWHCLIRVLYVIYLCGTHTNLDIASLTFFMSYTSVVHTQILDIASSEFFMSYSSMVRTQFLDFASSTFFVSYNSVVHTQILDIASSEFCMSYSSVVRTQFLDFASSAFFMRHTFMVCTQFLDFASPLKQTIPVCVLPKAISPEEARIALGFAPPVLISARTFSMSSSLSWSRDEFRASTLQFCYAWYGIIFDEKKRREFVVLRTGNIKQQAKKQTCLALVHCLA